MQTLNPTRARHWQRLLDAAGLLFALALMSTLAATDAQGTSTTAAVEVSGTQR